MTVGLQEKWYVAQTKPQKEALACQHLKNQGFEPFLPRVERTIRHARKFEQKLEPLFPGYVFINFDPDNVRWRSINGTIGVVRLLTDGEQPQAVEDGFIRELQMNADRRGVVSAAAFSHQVGQEVTLQSGPFSGLTGIICAADRTDRIKILMDVIGRTVEMTVSTSDLSPFQYVD